MARFRIEEDDLEDMATPAFGMLDLKNGNKSNSPTAPR
jgi:hypothetical protein